MSDGKIKIVECISENCYNIRQQGEKLCLTCAINKMKAELQDEINTTLAWLDEVEERIKR